MNISVIIPTFNRLTVLKQCLESLKNQILSKDRYEIVIIDDGSTAEIKNDIDEILNFQGIRYLYIKQNNCGPASARNEGIRNAKGDMVVFIGDDIIVDENFLQEHYEFHINNPIDNIAMLGHVRWSPEIRVSNFMKWLEISGFQFAYHVLTDGQEVNYNFFYACNISLKREYLLKNGLFNERFSYAAHEDSELGYRLGKLGMNLVYNSKAIGCHMHKISFNESLLRMEKVGKSARIFAQLHPELESVLSLKNIHRSVLKNIIKYILYPLFIFFGRNKITSSYWRIKMLKYYLKGYGEK